jgi:Acyl-CoA synthetases (AMP-forming)/AMP-acid ligases II
MNDADTAPPWLRGQPTTLGDLLRCSARTFGPRTALCHDGRAITFHELRERADAAAGMLVGLGVRPGDRVAVMAESRPETVELLFAVASVGAITVPVNPRLTPDELRHVLVDCAPMVVVTPSPAVENLDAAIDGLGPAPRVHRYDPGQPVAPAEEFSGWAGSPESPAIIMYTSGSSGRPKGVVLTHANLAFSTRNVVIARGMIGPDDAWLVAVPLFHISGVLGMLPYLMLGGRVVLAPSGRFDGRETLDLIRRENVTGTFLVPTQWQRVCAAAGPDDQDSPLRRVVWGGAPASPELLAEIGRAFPHADLYCSYGQTETTGPSCSLSPRDTPAQAGSIGRPVDSVVTRVVDDEGRDVPVGEVGELVYQGSTVFVGYWNDRIATEAAFVDGWLRSGDLVRQDSDGYLYLVGRKTDMIISGGENISPAELEQAIAALPGVAAACVVGLPHPTWGETPVAVVVRDPAGPAVTAEDVHEWCRQRLASYKRPTEIHFVTELPLTANGKVRKAELRAQLGARAATGTAGRP